MVNIILITNKVAVKQFMRESTQAARIERRSEGGEWEGV